MTRFQERRFSVPGPGATRDVATCAHGWVGRLAMHPVLDLIGVCMFCGAQVRKIDESWMLTGDLGRERTLETLE